MALDITCVPKHKMTSHKSYINSPNSSSNARPTSPSRNRPHQVQNFPIGSEVVAKYNFEGTKNKELSFTKGEILIITKYTADQAWHYVKNTYGKEGIVPTNRLTLRQGVQLQAMPWFHGKMDRIEAEKLLHPRENGLFLVRESNHYPGDYTLCVVYSSSVEHYRVKKNDSGMSVDEEIFFNNLIELIDHYKFDRDGLVCELRKPVEKKGKQEYCVDQKAFEKSGWVIDKTEIELQDELGHGEFGVVYKGIYKGKPVAVKTLKEANNIDDFLVEASSMTNLRHENLVQILGITMRPVPIYIVTEFMEKGSLTDYLRSRGRSVVKKSDQYKFSCDVCKAMVYLESKKVVHRDLAAQNVLLNELGTAKVSDFGLARSVEYYQDGGKFRIKWSAPEALKNNHNFTHKSDVWSYGILLWEIYSFGRVPYPRIPLTDVMTKVSGGYRMDAPDGCPAPIYKIMQDCWMINPDHRPNFDNILLSLMKDVGSFT